MRRVHVQKLHPGSVPLDGRQAHHLRDVLRLANGEKVEVFDDAGQTATATFHTAPDGRARIEVADAIRPPAARPPLVIASAVPKGGRADWMIEKLSELGIDRFIPLITARSVVAPEGRNKIQRWERVATEAAKQSRRQGVMRIDPPTALGQAAQQISSIGLAWHLSTAAGAPAAFGELHQVREAPGYALLIGPEGGWTPQEQQWLNGQSIPPLRLGDTILRTETAAVAAAVLLAVAIIGPSAGTPRSSGPAPPSRRC